VKYFDIIHRTEEFHSKEKKIQMLTILGPLMQILGQIPSTDSLSDELMQVNMKIIINLPKKEENKLLLILKMAKFFGTNFRQLNILTD
jgi:hypothetical protein